MAIDWSDWGPPVAVLIAGAATAWAMTTFRSGGGAGPSVDVEAERRRNELESTRDEVVEALKLLELEKEKLDPADYAAEREKLLARGARALEALETGVTAPAPAGAPAPAPVAAPPPVAGKPATGALSPQWQGALYALGAVAIGWLLWTFASSNSAARREGGSMTGSLPGEEQGAPMAAQDPTQSPQFKQREDMLKAALVANPNDLSTLNQLTQLYLSHGVPQLAMQQNDLALKVDPKDHEARTLRALLTAMMGMFDKALVDLEGVIAEDPTHAKALAYKGLILLEKQQYPEAAAALELAVAQDPTSPQLRAALEEAKRGGPAAGGAPPAPSAGGDLLARGTVVLDPALQASLKGTETLFLSLSNPQRPGPPVAADVVKGPFSFPLAFDLTTADIRAMPGAGEVPAVMDLKVRIDLDGNAMTKEPGTPSAVVTGLARGTDGLQVVLTLDGAAAAAPPGTPAPAGNPLLAPMAPAGGGGGGGLLASGTATLAPGKAIAPGETVFLSVRDPAGGPPIAARKLAGATFPLKFELTDADVVQMGMARPVPASFNVSVRIDKDGNAMTKEGEPEALATGVAKGATGLSLELR